MMEGIYLCESCLEKHQFHSDFTDSIKNLLTHEFLQWRSLMEHVQGITKVQVEKNIVKQQRILEYLNKDTFFGKNDVSLHVMLDELIKNLAIKLVEIKEYCKRNDLDNALRMRSEMGVFSSQLQEMEQKSTISSMFSFYFNQPSVESGVFQGIGSDNQFFLHGNQYENRIKQLSSLIIGHKLKIDHYEDYMQKLQELNKQELLNLDSFS